MSARLLYPNPGMRAQAALYIKGVRWYLSIGRPEKAEDYLWKLERLGYAGLPRVMRWWQRRVKATTVACGCGDRILQSVLV